MWLTRINNLFKADGRAQLTQYRMQATRNVLIKSYPWIEKLDKKEFIKMGVDLEYVTRKMRDMTEGKQTEIKRKLEQEFILNL